MVTLEAAPSLAFPQLSEELSLAGHHTQSPRSGVDECNCDDFTTVG
jgi:hypothetical protein